MVAVSVVMSVFNEPLEWLNRSINSILSQTLDDIEFIIVDDNPENNELKNFLDDLEKVNPFVKIVFNEKNLGLTKSLNRALNLSNGMYIARMDADDEASPDRLLVQKRFLDENLEIDVCGSYAKCFGDISFYSSKKFLVGKTNEEILISSFFDSPMIHPSVMFRNKKNIFYNENFLKAQDYELWGRLLVCGCKMQNIPLFLLNYRKTKKSKMFDYVSAQVSTANNARSKLLNHFFCDVSQEKIDLHNNICSRMVNQNCDIGLIENWLREFRFLLEKKFPGNDLYIRKKVSMYWVASALQYCSFFRCVSSPLCVSPKFSILIRFLLKKIRKLF